MSQNGGDPQATTFPLDLISLQPLPKKNQGAPPETEGTPLFRAPHSPPPPGPPSPPGPRRGTAAPSPAPAPSPAAETEDSARGRRPGRRGRSRGPRGRHCSPRETRQGDLRGMELVDVVSLSNGVGLGKRTQNLWIWSFLKGSSG